LICAKLGRAPRFLPLIFWLGKMGSPAEKTSSFPPKKIIPVVLIRSTLLQVPRKTFLPLKNLERIDSILPLNPPRRSG